MSLRTKNNNKFFLHRTKVAPYFQPVIKVVLSESSEGLRSGMAPATEKSPEVERPRLDIGRDSTKSPFFSRKKAALRRKRKKQKEKTFKAFAKHRYVPSG